MLKLFQFAPCWDLPNASPFCMKLETYLKMTDLPYEVVTFANPNKKSPTGKFPMIEDEGVIIADSDLIIQHLKNKHGDPLDKNLSEQENAQRIALQRLIEEHLYWVIVYSRWADEAGWKVTNPAYFGFLPKPLRLFVPALVRKQSIKQLQAQGMGRHSQEAIYDFGKKDIDAIADYLTKNKFILNDTPSSLDATAYAFIANIIHCPIDSPLKQHTLSIPIFADYCQRMQTRYFG